jgi:hypothetical protein
MAFSYSPKIVTEGLVLYLDAANPYSYVSGSTSWNDISRGGNNGTLVNGPTFNSANNGSIVFDGVDDYANVPNNTILNSNTGTISVWFNYTSAPGNGSVLLGKTDVFGSLNGLNIFIHQGALGVQIKGNSPTATNIPGPNLNTNTWYNFTLTYTSGVSYSSYSNGIFTETNSLLSFNFSTQPLRLARSVDTYWSNFGGQISITQLYNRALSAQEVLQNYNATKTRFGLT